MPLSYLNMLAKSTCFREGFAYLEVAAALVAAAVLLLLPGAGLAPLLLPALFWIAGAAGRRAGCWPYALASAPHLAAFLFVASALLSLSVTYPNGLLTVFGPFGAYKFHLILAAAALFMCLSHLPTPRSVWVVLGVFGAAGAFFAVLYFLTNDFASQPVEFQFLSDLGLIIQRSRGISLPQTLLLQPNTSAGTIAFLLPALAGFALGAAHQVRRSRLRALLLTLSILGIILILAALILTASRGAWVALAVAVMLALAWKLAAFIQRKLRVETGKAAAQRAALAAVGLAVAGAAAWAFYPRIIVLFPGFIMVNQSYISRFVLYQEAAQLAAQVPFTGIGLGTFPMAHAVYRLLIHVPFLPHAHNLFLDLAVSQGWPGVISFALLILVSIRAAFRLSQSPRLELHVAVILAMLVILLLHGLVDDALYGSRALVFWWVPSGLLAALNAHEPRVSAPPGRRARAAGGLALLALFALAAVFWKDLRVAYEINRGVVEQARVELGLYDPGAFDRLTIDQIRRQADLSLAEAYYYRALALDPAQPTALQRLGEIALSRGEYELGLNLLQQAWDAGSRDRVTRLLYASALVANGSVEKAAEAASGVTWAESRLSFEGWYRYWRDGDYRRAADAFRAALLLNPGNAEVQGLLREAEARLR